MPYKSEKIKIEGTKLDRRRKLTEDQKDYIRWLREEEGLSQRQLAAMFGVSRRLITFILDPEKEKRSKERQAAQEGRTLQIHQRAVGRDNERASPLQREIA